MNFSAAEGAYRRLAALQEEKYWNVFGVVLEPEGLGTGFSRAVFCPRMAQEPAVQDIILVIRYTRRWLQYGIIGHAVVCIFIAALQQTLK